MNLKIPDGQCWVGLSYDLEMCAGYSPTMTNHGRIIPDLQKYTLQLCDIAEAFDVKLHFFYVANGLEHTDTDYLYEILRRGHVIDSHTYDHLSLTYPDMVKLDQDLRRANDLLQDKLGVEPVVLRGPGGIINGLNHHPKAQQIILKNGFRYVSSAYKDPLTNSDFQFLKKDESHEVNHAALSQAVQLTTFEPPYRYESGLVELPLQGLTDRNWFDTHYCTNPQTFDEWRESAGHQPVAADWQAPWTAPGALEHWIDYNLAVFDRACSQKTLWMPVWHPYTHYLYDRENIALKSLLEYVTKKPDARVVTLRDVIDLIEARK